MNKFGWIEIILCIKNDAIFIWKLDFIIVRINLIYCAYYYILQFFIKLIKTRNISQRSVDVSQFFLQFPRRCEKARRTNTEPIWWIIWISITIDQFDVITKIILIDVISNELFVRLYFMNNLLKSRPVRWTRWPTFIYKILVASWNRIINGSVFFFVIIS